MPDRLCVPSSLRGFIKEARKTEKRQRLWSRYVLCKTERRYRSISRQSVCRKMRQTKPRRGTIRHLLPLCVLITSILYSAIYSRFRSFPSVVDCGGEIWSEELKHEMIFDPLQILSWSRLPFNGAGERRKAKNKFFIMPRPKHKRNAERWESPLCPLVMIIDFSCVFRFT